jgi:hypothetical protein
MLKSFSSTLSTSSITGTLGVPNGGTGATTYPSGYILLGNGTSPVTTTNKFIFSDSLSTLYVGTGGTGATGNAIVLNGTNNSSNGSLILAQRNGANAWIFGDIQTALGSGTGIITYVYGANPTVWYNNGLQSLAINSNGTLSPLQAASAPAYQKGAIYFDTTLNKLRVGGATGWETITSI